MSDPANDTTPLPPGLLPEGVSIDLLRHILTSAHCLLWVADVKELPREKAIPGAQIFDVERQTCLAWDLQIIGEDAVREWLPIPVPPGETIRTHFWKSRVDKAKCDEVGYSALMRGASGYRHEFCCATGPGTNCWVLEDAQVTPLETEPGKRRWRVSGVCMDISERKRVEEQLDFQARHDALTGLPNRAFLTARLGEVLQKARDTEESVALLFIDIDNFKIINDTLGHAAGDDVLVTLTRRLKSCVRSHDMIARLGGDEFTVLMSPAPSVDIALSAAERIARTIQRAIPLHGQTLFPSCSIGVAFSADTPGDYRTETLLRNADNAMYYAKSRGKGRVERFLPDMNSGAMENFEIASELRRSVERGDLELHYQPILDLSSGRVCEVEALVRWRHSRFGGLSPERFIPIAEETGSIIPLGIWVLREACRQMQQWRRSLPELAEHLIISVNLSVRQLQDPGLVDAITQILDDTGLPPSTLKLEITETAMMLDAAANRQTVGALREMGIKIAMDDFGIGYSSMAYLDYLPIDTIKIDRTFIQRLGSTVAREDSEAIVRAMIAMAKAMGIEVTSEGIEGEHQLEQLKALDCDRGQGHYFARPLTGPDFASFLMTTVPATVE